MPAAGNCFTELDNYRLMVSICIFTQKKCDVDSVSFFQEVYAIVKEIPRGKVTTYGQIAELIGKPGHARMVGYAMCHAPEELNLPCHRVVSSKGRLAPSWLEQRKRLEAEGVCFKRNGCVDMGKSVWRLDCLLFDKG